MVIPAILSLYLSNLIHIVQPERIKLWHLNTKALAKPRKHRIESLCKYWMKAPIQA